MTEATTATSVRRLNDQISVIDIKGEITAASESTLMDAFNEASGDATKAVILNFGGLDYMNSSGIGLLVTLLVRAQRQHQELLAYGLNEHYRQIFELTRLDEAIGIHDTEDSATAAAGR
ncbi:MAG: anti-sigma factor antagonist [Actinobacteria bacterium]|nr:anti-sigma factor antagonist [Actinomycetota bacterium]